ncbi:flavodoxin reductase [Niastella caeni]|uniref:Flavodoxin reductase n=1 Tax=Niastella caeni TaxID=2569763 RepID=A0A4S8HGN0_9BACT|nr:FAD-binding oxidoreductase [Niastella caeni]THU34187.1 flavodoxin reductase [Niastella caeni]
MESHIVKITAIHQVTHDVKCFRIEKPSGYQFVPGQATEVAINKSGWENERRPFTFTSLNHEPTLEFTIKRYVDHKGVTDQLHQLNAGDELILHDVWGAIEYKGPGYFIAGGAGITPFIAILRQLHRDNQLTGNTLFFSNKTAADIIYVEELTAMLGNNVRYILSREQKQGYENGIINTNFLRSHITDFSKHFYVCGPDKMITDINAALEKLGANANLVVFEK